LDELQVFAREPLGAFLYWSSLAGHSWESNLDSPLEPLQQRVAELEARLESAFALNTRLKSLEEKVGKQGKSSTREWVATIGPYVSSLVLLLVGFWIKDSVQLALARKQLDLAYVTQMRDLIKGFDESSSSSEANANAIALALFGEYSVMPLVERLETGDVAHAAAEKGLRMIGNTHSTTSCSSFADVVRDKARRFTWQTHKTMIRVIGQSCSDDETKAVLTRYQSELKSLGSDAGKVGVFARRYSNSEGFDNEGASSLRAEIDEALRLVESSRVQT
jgi:hypothetical protein